MNNTVKKEYIVDGLCCASCAAKIEDKVGKLDGIRAASMNMVNQMLTIEMDVETKDNSNDIFNKIKNIVKTVEPDAIVSENKVSKSIKKTLILEGLCCSNCASKIETITKNTDGVNSVSLDFVSKKLTFEMDAKQEVNTIVDQVTKIVKQVEPDINVIDEEFNNINKKSQESNNNLLRDKNLKDLVRIIIGSILYGITFFLNDSSPVKFYLFVIAFILVGSKVLIKSAKNILRGQIFDENFLMSIATIGAFAIKEYPEGVAVMLFYQIGEYIQGIAVNRSRKSITALLNIKPDFANLKNGDDIEKVDPEDVNINDIIVVKPGEKVPLDGIVLEGKSMVDTSNLTGESVPREVEVGSDVLGGFINKNGLLTIRVTKEFGESAISKILDLVQNASSKKAKTENFITKFARYYTPVVVIVALLLAIIPPLVIPGAIFSEWIYRALVFLVISCPCALVISIPLGFFGGIGGASKRGILVKGSNYLEALNKVSIVVFDKTGTLTKGVFKVTEISPKDGLTKDELLEYASYAESYSNHPIATSILKSYGKEIIKSQIADYDEIAGYGIKVKVKGKEVLAGNIKLMENENIPYDNVETMGTVVHIAIEGSYAGYIVISDEVKEDSAEAIRLLKQLGIKKTVMLTGDNKNVASKVGNQLKLDEVYSELLPDQKVEKLEMLFKQKSANEMLLFVGDGVNDAPVLARADIGVAMGALGSDAAIEAADIVIMNDEPSKIASAIKIARKTRQIVWQNIIFALGIKAIILTLGAFGIATMWEAVFGDVGVTIIAVLNAMRVLKVEDI